MNLLIIFFPKNFSDFLLFTMTFNILSTLRSTYFQILRKFAKNNKNIKKIKVKTQKI